MTDAPTDRLRDTVRYLRGVRPIDPEELRTYVPGLTKAEIDEWIQEHAFDLGLRRTDAGTFVPATGDPLRIDGSEIEQLPAALDDTLVELLEAAYGTEWATGESGDRLRDAIRAFKGEYFRGNRVTYDRDTAYGYLIYHFPASYAAIQYTLASLGRQGLLSDSLSILDVGAGVGGQALGVAAFFDGASVIRYDALEPSAPARTILEQTLSETGPNCHWSITGEQIEEAQLQDSYDLIICSNVLNELSAPADTVRRLLSGLGEDGSLVIVEPADERTSRELRRIESAVCAEPTVDVYMPDLRLWPDRQPTDDCWSFTVKPELALPTAQRALDTAPRKAATERPPGTGEFCNVDVQYSPAILRTDGTRAIDVRVARQRVRPLAESATAVTERIDCTVVKLSHSLTSDSDAHPLYVVGDGSQSEEHFAVRTAMTQATEALSSAAYGAILDIQGTLLLWNDDESAYNLVVDDRTFVDAISPR